MRRLSLALAALLPLLRAFALCGGTIIFSGAGGTSASGGALSAEAAFRAGIGGMPTQITWDDVPDSFAAPNHLPADFYNVNVTRGVFFVTPGTGFEASARPGNPSGTPTLFGDLNAGYPANFTAFSSPRLFTPLGSNVVDVYFFVPGTSASAVVSAFGAMFTDVETANTTSIEFFDRMNGSLGKFFAPTTVASAGFSYLGIIFNAGEEVGRVRISLGTASLGGSESLPSADLVVLDNLDFSPPACPTEAPSVFPPVPAAVPQTLCN